jgi:hypothetical protein
MTMHARKTVEIDSLSESTTGAHELLAFAAEAERRLLKAERKAESRLAEAVDQLARDQDRLRKAQDRVERSRAAEAAAVAALRNAQLQRAAGPRMEGA